MEVIEGKIYIKGRLRKASIGIEDGKIVAIKKVLYGKTYDYGNLAILPSAIDMHVHFREPGYEYKEDFSTGSKAFLLSGFTFVADMPNTEPPVVNDEILKQKAEKIRKKAWIDYALYAGLTKQPVENASLYKLYLSGDNDIFVGYEELPEVMKKLKEKDALLSIHAEDRECIKREGKNLREFERNNPVDCESKAIRKIVEINERVGVKLHICHITSSENAKFLLKKGVSFGVTPHHILFSYNSKFSIEAMGKVNPPLRSEKERKRLFNMVMKGRIPVMESDHAPHTLEEKRDFERAPGGMPGEAMLPIMLYFVKNGRMKLRRLVKMVSENPANSLGISKGKIEVGRDADFIIVDFKDVKKVRPLSKCGWSCYEGMNGIYPRDVWMRGSKVVEDGEVVGEPRGKRIK